MLSFQFDWVLLLSIVVTALLPIITAWVTTAVASPRTKAIVLAALSAITGFGAELLNALQTGTAYEVFGGLLNAFVVFVVAVATYFGFWRATQVPAKVNATGGFIGAAD